MVGQQRESESERKWRLTRNERGIGGMETGEERRKGRRTRENENKWRKI